MYSYLSLLIRLLFSISEIIALWKIFEKAGEHGRYIFIPGFNIFVISRIARRTDLFWYIIGGGAIAIVFAFLNIWALLVLSLIFVAIVTCIISYSVAKNFGRSNSAALVFAVSPINYLVLGFSDDEYMYKDGHLVLKRPSKKPIDENILKDIEEEIHTKHLGENNNSNQMNSDDGDDENIGNGDIGDSQNFQPVQNPQNINNYQNNGGNVSMMGGNTPSIYN